MQEKELFEIDGFKVYANSMYLTKDKPDMDAPTGFIEARTTKLPSDGVDDVFHFNYVTTSERGDGSWDTGFYETSPCYRNLSQEEAKKRVKMVVENVLKPYRKHRAKADLFDIGDEENFLRYSFRVASGKRYNTKDPEDVMNLYVALLAGYLTPEGLVGDPRYSQSAFVVVDENKAVRHRDEVGSNAFEAVTAYSFLESQKPELLLCILDYMDMPRVSESIPKETKQAMFFQMVSQSAETTRQFLQYTKEAETDTGAALFYVYSKLKKMAGKGGKFQRADGKEFFYGEEPVGADIKTAATNIAKNPRLSKIKQEILNN